MSTLHEHDHMHHGACLLQVSCITEPACACLLQVSCITEQAVSLGSDGYERLLDLTRGRVAAGDSIVLWSAGAALVHDDVAEAALLDAVVATVTGTGAAWQRPLGGGLAGVSSSAGRGSGSSGSGGSSSGGGSGSSSGADVSGSSQSGTYVGVVYIKEGGGGCGGVQHAASSQGAPGRSSVRGPSLSSPPSTADLPPATHTATNSSCFVLVAPDGTLAWKHCRGAGREHDSNGTLAWDQRRGAGRQQQDMVGPRRAEGLGRRV